MKTFSEFLNEGAPIEDLNTILSNFISFTLLFSVQTHIYHLLTKSNSEHLALKEFYDDIRDDADEVAEKFLALGGVLSPTKTYNVMYVYNKEMLLQQLSEYRLNINTLIDATSSSEFIGMNDIFVDIQNDIDKLVYKLGLE